jgi:hypothetical protein
MPNIHPAQPRHFAGELVAKTVDCCAGLHRMEVQLVDDDNRAHTVYLAYGRGDAAARYAQAQFDMLQVGGWYHGSATLMHNTTGRTEWAGHVPPLQPCQRRHLFSTASRAVSRAAA